jgi:hypothetical protein
MSTDQDPEDRYRRLMDHRDPVLREIGGQLQRAEIRPRDLLRAPEYREVIERGLRRLRAYERRRG